MIESCSDLVANIKYSALSDIGLHFEAVFVRYNITFIYILFLLATWQWLKYLDKEELI